MFDIPVSATLDACGYLLGLYWALFSFFDHSSCSVQFSVPYLVPPFWEHLWFWLDIPSMTTLDADDARGHLAWTLLGIIFFLRSSHSKFSYVRPLDGRRRDRGLGFFSSLW